MGPSDHAAVGLDNLAVDPRGLVGGQEADHLGHFRRLADAVERAHGGGADQGRVVLASTEQASVDRTGGHRVDPDAAAGQFLGHGADQALDRRLAGGVEAADRHRDAYHGRG